MGKKEQDSLNFLNFLNNKDPNIKFTVKRQVNHSIAFLDVFVSGIDNQNLILQTYHKSTLCKMCPNTEYFRSVFSPNTEKHAPAKTPHLDTFHAVQPLPDFS